MQPFTRAYANEVSVELRGDFAPDAWVRGVSMVSDGGAWAVSVEAAWGSDLQYKHFVNGTTWELDPANPNSVPDGKGNTNSVLRNLTCAQWSCVGR